MNERFNYALVLLLGCIALTGWSQDQRYADSLEKLVGKKTGADKIRTLNDLTFFYSRKDTRRAIAFGTESLILARKQADKSLLANTLNDLSTAYITNGDLERSIRLNEEALQIRKSKSDSVGLVSSYAKLGLAYQELSQYDRAAEEYKLGLAIARELGMDMQELQIMINLGNILELSGLLKEAYSMQKNIVKQAEELGDDQALITAIGNLAGTCRKLKRYKESEQYFKQVIPLIEASGQTEYLGVVYQGMGVLKRDQKKHTEGLDYYKKAYRIYRQINSDIGVGTVAVNIGNVYSELNQPDSAAIYFEEGLKYSKASRSYKQIKSAYEGMALMEKQRGNFAKAYEYMKLVVIYKDSTDLFEGNSAISEMYARYETEKKDRELTQSQLKNSEKDKQIAQAQLKIATEKQNRLIWSGVGLLVLLFAGFFSRNLYLKRKAAMEEIELTKKNEQLRRERELNEQKIEISRELHDNIGSQLTYIISSMDNLTYTIPEGDKLTGTIREISEFGRGTMHELRSTIWAMNSEDGSVELLFRKLEELRSKIPVGLVLRNELKGNPPLKAIEMLNLYRIGQEVIQNCLKYANATTLTITAKDDPAGGITMTFEDNGAGFDTAAGPNGNGLRNMRHRCEQSGGTFSITSEMGKGTTIGCSLRHLSY